MMKNKLAMAFFLITAAGFASALIGEGYDNTAPTVSITSPTASQQFAAGTTSITMQYTATDEGGGSIAKYWVSKDNTTWVNNGTNTSYAFTGLSAGNYTFYLIATDDSDNNSSTASVSISILSSTEIPTGSCLTLNCNDNNPCTTDGCSNNACTHTNIADNTSCGTGKLCKSGVCTAKTCTELGGTLTCDLNANDCLAWQPGIANCCLNCTPKPTQTILCSFPDYLSTEPVSVIFIEPSSLASSYDFNILGTTLKISPTVSNTLADTIVTSYPGLYLVSSNLTGIPEMTPEQVYLLGLLKNNILFGSSIYSAKSEDYLQIYTLMDSSRLRWWNASKDDTCEPKLTPSDLGVSLQTMHYFRINNLWLLWYEKARPALMQQPVPPSNTGTGGGTKQPAGKQKEKK